MDKLRLHSFEEIISLENLLGAWGEFAQGKRGRSDAQEFEFALMDHLVSLHRRLASGSYRHGGYAAFAVSDPKPRRIHKASVEDRVLHRALYRQLYPAFDRTFVADSFSCRVGKGTHRALNRFQRMARRVSGNHRRTAWVLKCDIRKFFASVDHAVLLAALGKRISDARLLGLLAEIIRSFETSPGKGLPLGNLTSQLLANVYMDAFDKFVKHRMMVRHYIRYADDFVLLHHDRAYLVVALELVRDFLFRELRLELHPDKIEIRTFASGVDFLGWVHFSDHRVLRSATKRRAVAATRMSSDPAVQASYLGLLSYGNAYKLRSGLL